MLNIHKRENIFLEQIAENDDLQRKFDKALTWSLIETKVLRRVNLTLAFLLFIIAPIVKSLVLKDIYYLAPIPLQIPLLNDKPGLQLVVLVLIESVIIYYAVTTFLFAICFVFMFINATYIYFFVDAIDEYLKFKKSVEMVRKDGEEENGNEEQEDHAWVRNLIMITDQLSE